MSSLNVITLLLNGLTLPLALGFLLIVLWHDARKEVNQFFAVFLFLVVLWNTGSLLALGISLVDVQSPLLSLAVSLMELGFAGASVAAYALTAILVGVHTRRFRWLALSSLMLVMIYQIFITLNNLSQPFAVSASGFTLYRFQSVSALYYLIFGGTTLYLLWRYRLKLRSRGLLWGLSLFAIGQSFGFLNPTLGISGASTTICSVAALVISFAILRREIITPLAERITQLEAIHKVSLAITSQLGIEKVLNQIATQAAGWLGADAAGIFLTQGQMLKLATVYNLPSAYLEATIPLGQGIAGTVAQTQRSIYMENYQRDWRGDPDLPLAQQTFGSVISVPLIYGSETIGVLMVVAGRQSRLFYQDEVRSLELLSAQAAVAITHSHLFDEQEKLTQAVQAARSQLEIVLTSTENPVIAVDRKLRLIFANPAAQRLLDPIDVSANDPITKRIPDQMLPRNSWVALRHLLKNQPYSYELTIKNSVFLCHLAPLGGQHPSGWVAVLNDITQLKELDRLKSEMVRMTSHDLKNPLQAAMANLELLEEDLGQHSSEEVRKSIAAIDKQLNRMNRIIRGILDLERVKSGQSAMVIAEAEPIIQHVIEELRSFANDQHIQLSVEIAPDTPRFMADVEQVERALINLVENAIKFSVGGGDVTIRAYGENRNVLFEIRDYGIGIPEKLQSQLFNRFVRGAKLGQKGAEHISGSGLGLSLVKAIVDNHHGQVWLQSQEGQGARFYISLPAIIPEMA